MTRKPRSRRPSFHFSVDDVLPSLIEVTDKEIALEDHHFFRVLKKIYKEYGVCSNLYLFFSQVIDGRERFLHEVRCLEAEITEGWLRFGPHAENPQTPPYQQSVSAQERFVHKTTAEIDRITPGWRSSSTRFHFFSECYEIANTLLELGYVEMFLTDKKAASYVLHNDQRNQLLKNGSILINGLTASRSNLRIEDLIYNGDISTIMLSEYVSRNTRLVLFTHEYEFLRPEFDAALSKVIALLAEEFGFAPEHY